METHEAALYGLLVALYGVPVVFTNVPQHALTQAMIVYLGLLVVMSE